MLLALLCAAPAAPGDSGEGTSQPTTGPASRPAETPPSLQQRISKMVAAYEKQSRATVGVSIVDLRSGRRVAVVRPDELRTPASNQKLITAAFALERLGGDFRFTTAVYLLGKDIIAAGDGDPTLGDPVLAEAAGKSIYAELDRWAEVIARRTGGTLAGDLLVCGRADPTGYRHADWPEVQHDKWYAAPVAGLNFHNNCFDVTFRADNSEVTPVVSPASRFIKVTRNIKPGRKHLWSLSGSSDDSAVVVKGTVKGPARDPISVAANNPPLLLGRVLADRIVRAGTAFAGGIRAVKAAPVKWSEAQLLCRTTTPLAAVMKRANKRSLNMAAECIFLRAGDGTWPGTARIADGVLVKTYGLARGSFLVRDGGGLSRKNRAAPSALTGLLAAVLQRKDARVLLDSLPVSGIDGTMRKRLARTPYLGRVAAKTGYIAGVSCLSGYVLDDAGKPAMALAILANRVPAGEGWQAKGLQDSICRVLVDSLAGEAGDQRPKAGDQRPEAEGKRRNSEEQIENRQSTIANRQSQIDNRQLKIGNWKLEIDNRRFTTLPVPPQSPQPGLLW